MCLLCKKDSCSCFKDTGLLLLRLVLAVVFIYHGWAKITNIDGTLGFFTQIGLGNTVLVYLAGYGEFIGGILMGIGLLTRYASLVLMAVSAVAIATVHLSKGFGIMGGGYEYVLTLLVVSAAVGLMGAGKYSVDAKMKKVL